MIQIMTLLLALFMPLPAMAQTEDDAAANRLFVEAVQLWNRAEGESDATRHATLQRVQSNLKTIVERHGGSSLAVRLVIGETVGPLSVARVEGPARAAAATAAEAEAHARAARFKPVNDAAGVGRVLRDCPDCPELVVVPAGATRLASGRDVTIAVPFAVGKFEVTFAEWDDCVAAGGCTHRPNDELWGRGRRPVMNVSWDDAQQYVAWLSRTTGKTYRLLSEAEWEYAAQAGSALEQVAQRGANEANCDGCGSRWDNKQTAPAGSFAANAFGLHDMLGNVWEWTKNGFVAGGSWNRDPGVARSASRGWSAAVNRGVGAGFRVARTL